MAEKPFIDRMHPALKIWVLMVVALVASLDFMPFGAMILFAAGLVLAEFFSSARAVDVLHSVRGFIGMSLGFVVIILLVRVLSSQPPEVVAVLGLGFRIILISSYSALFVKTTNPTEFAMALIRSFRMPVDMGFALLTAYRFLPTFREEMDTIRYAHQVRGVTESRNPLSRVWNMKRYVIPMMAGAVRKAIRISMAMETRAFGKYPDRTWYRNISMPGNQIAATAGFTLAVILLVTGLTMLGLTRLGFVYTA